MLTCMQERYKCEFRFTTSCDVWQGLPECGAELDSLEMKQTQIL